MEQTIVLDEDEMRRDDEMEKRQKENDIVACTLEG